MDIFDMLVKVELVPMHLEIIIPFKWISMDGAEIVNILNNGVNRNRLRRIFFSRDIDDKPKFDIAIPDRFVFERMSNFMARVIAPVNERDYGLPRPERLLEDARSKRHRVNTGNTGASRFEADRLGTY